MEAFILTGTFGVVCRNSLYLTELAKRGLKILLITQARWRDEAFARMAEPGHPASMIHEIGFIDGGVSEEGSYNAGVVALGQLWREKYEIAGVLAVGETLVEPTGILADALGMPSPGLRATRVCRSKYLQRFYLPEFSPLSIVLPAGERDTLHAEDVRFPAVVKPASRHSSSGVEMVDDWDELHKQLRTYPEHETVLVEAKVVGQEFSVESLVQHGKAIFTSVTRKETTDSHARTFVELSHSVPSDRLDVQDALLDANQKMLDKLGFENGIAHAEWRVDADGKPFLMEVAARTPGDGIMVLYGLATGAAAEPEITKIALGEDASYPTPARHARQIYLEHELGTLADVVIEWDGIEPHWLGEDGLWPEIQPGAQDDPPTLRALLVLKGKGTTLTELSASEDRAVTFLIDAPTVKELDELEHRVREAITIKVEK
ncbi:acetyl-CoA carboxylase biotin carboxylase subunit family protein [Amycolatopsis sp. NPDC059657]|uniref:ATP-grasp domain-containing protein n=1 Tax=Amycolatopsis sp. NPDC059657 TaxID=3346899 RepID=UPI00366B852D